MCMMYTHTVSILDLHDYVRSSHEIKICPPSVPPSSVRVANSFKSFKVLSNFMLLPVGHTLERFFVLKVILGSLGEFPIFDNLTCRKWQVVERNRVKFGPRGLVFSVCRILVNAPGNGGVIRCISDFQLPCISKTAGLGAKHTPKSLCYPVLCGLCLPSCQVECPSPCASC